MSTGNWLRILARSTLLPDDNAERECRAFGIDLRWWWWTYLQRIVTKKKKKNPFVRYGGLLLLRTSPQADLFNDTHTRAPGFISYFFFFSFLPTVQYYNKDILFLPCQRVYYKQRAERFFFFFTKMAFLTLHNPLRGFFFFFYSNFVSLKLYYW